MTLRIVVPVRPLGQGKSRLSPALSAAARAALARAMFAHVLAVARAAAPVHVISRDDAVLAMADHAIRELGEGLNPALEQAARELGGQGPVLALSADLPLLCGEDLAAMTALLDGADVVAAPDRMGKGTNALLLAQPGLIPYRFGPDSLAAHRTAAEQAGLRFTCCERAGLASDVDRPEDLALLPPGLASAA